ncbi:MAG: alpha/beta hydrolase [Propionibacteriaceae bacterium]|nr:alpha/beta hydrolase [Propionibacteriaceae bacterium]
MAPPEPSQASAQSLQPAFWSDQWAPDVYLEGYETLTWHMPDRPHLPEEGDGYLKATLVRPRPDQSTRAILHIHGWNEYFFEDHLARVWQGLGYDFYALDLHRYGRSLQPGELFGYTDSITGYFEEIDAAVDLIKRTHSQIVLSGHSTGGLTCAMWADARPGQLVGLVLNSPWLDLQGSFLTRLLTPPIVKGLSTKAPTMELPKAESDLYIRSLHQAFGGEWNFDLALKKPSSSPIRPGWLAAVVRAQDRIADRLDIDVPILLALSARSSAPKQFEDEDVRRTDLALDVELVAARAPKLGWHVSLVRLEGALHDIALSAEPVRRRFFDEIRRWDLAYVSGPKAH